ncbi:Lsr2 family protein [Kytococcus sedentarius]|uniref:histone-like nucleoid-structuring protein Lsr2 n=1 Tax=Kytococcus sedentarius TaxID=1276 RepID=UPI0038504681
MAQRTILQLIDDLDGSEADETVLFSLDGRSYEIDLTSENADRLRAALNPWAAAGRRVSATRRQGKTASADSTRRRALEKIRQWGRDNGWQVSDRGRVPQDLQDAYRKAHSS